MSILKKATREVPVIAIRGSVIFPFTDNVLTIGRDKSVFAINNAFANDKTIAVFTQKDTKNTDPSKKDMYEIGTLVTLSQIMSGDGDLHALIKGIKRVRLVDVKKTSPFLTGKVEEIDDKTEITNEIKALSNQLASLFKKAVDLGKQTDVLILMRVLAESRDPHETADQIASLLDIKLEDRQKILETLGLKERMQLVFDLLVKEINVLEIEKTLSVKTQQKFEDQVRKNMLREKKKTIEKELGEDSDEADAEEITSYKKRIKNSKMPLEVKKRANKELKKLSQMNPNNPESGYIRNYLDWLCDMPWGKCTANSVSIKKANKVLQNEHYALKDVKERILEYLSIMKVKKEKEDSHPTILCFIGPPGVGKTSIGKSIAHALNRKFVRISLGGIRDEAEIRGHRRTYVGALPGRIIQGIKTAGVNNPVFMLDEIDKMGSDFRGDPSSAMLEALDPEQNKEFSDHYLEVPYDLSQVMFICTGNMLDGIPSALRDRLEIINFSSYTSSEKFNIAEKYLWPKVLKQHGLDKYEVKIDKKALEEVIAGYTREAGVRDLERKLAQICRKITRLVAEKKKYPKMVKTSQVIKFLGVRRYYSTVAEKKNEIGMSTGLAWTPVGGDILFIEVALMPGKGRLTLTGQLGDVMKESAQAAFTWTRSHWKELGLKEKFGESLDIHIHVPEGAVRKDGPSAGIAITTALVSALTKRAVKRTVAMTGEITLRGRVMEIGGVKEKVIAAHRAGIKTIIMPKENKKDWIEDVSDTVKDEVKFYFVEKYNEVLPLALQGWK